MSKRHLAAFVAAAALATSGGAWAGAASQPMSYNTSGDSSRDASSNQLVNGGGAHAGGKWTHASGNGANHHGGHGYGQGAYASNGGSGTGAGYGKGADPGILKHGTGVSHLALLAGGNEVGKDGKADAGDEDGKGAASLSLDPEAGTLCFGLVVNNIDGPVAAHIHQGRAGQNGPVVVPLQAPDAGNPGAVSGCIRHVDRALLHAIHAHPWAYYVNIHTSAYPDGAIRGQIH